MTQIWNTLLKLKNLPYGSVHCIQDKEQEILVQNIISKVVSEGCFDDAAIHDRFIEKYYDWIRSSKLNTILGLENFTAKAFSNGTTEAFDKFYLKNNKRRLRYFKGEYMYHIASGSAFFDDMKSMEEDTLDSNDVLVVSLPFADTGDEHPKLKETLDICDKLGIPVLIDCCYFGVCGGVTFDFNHPCITDITFSLSKNFPVQFLRIGMRLTRTDNDDPLFVYNKNKYVNRLGAAVGLELIQIFGPDYNYGTYRETQEKFCAELGVEPTPCVFFANSKEKFPEYNRGTSSNRLCFSKYLKSKTLPS